MDAQLFILNYLGTDAGKKDEKAAGFELQSRDRGGEYYVDKRTRAQTLFASAPSFV